jgi:hypothetical protein
MQRKPVRRRIDRLRMARGRPVAATVIEHARELLIWGRRGGRFSETHENLDQVKVAQR